MRDSITVRVPASSANLGPGFDSFGLALALYDRVRVDVGGTGWTAEVSGEGATNVPLDGDHLIFQAMHQAFELLGEVPRGLQLRCQNGIPHSRGLGSSAAAITAGIVAARALAGGHERFDDIAMYQLASDLEGHPDNVAAAMFGGFTIAWTDGAAASVHRIGTSSDVTIFVPPEGVATSQARDLLTETVRHDDAAANSARAALLVAALTGNPDLLLPATEDWLHQAERSSVMPQSHKLMRQLRVEGVPAVISGAGPSVLAFGRGLDGFALPEWRVHELEVDTAGAICQE